LPDDVNALRGQLAKALTDLSGARGELAKQSRELARQSDRQSLQLQSLRQQLETLGKLQQAEMTAALAAKDKEIQSLRRQAQQDKAALTQAGETSARTQQDLARLAAQVQEDRQAAQQALESARARRQELVEAASEAFLEGLGGDNSLASCQARARRLQLLARLPALARAARTDAARVALDRMEAALTDLDMLGPLSRRQAENFLDRLAKSQVLALIDEALAGQEPAPVKAFLLEGRAVLQGASHAT
jgi:chromosome segregation ATPase